MPTKRKFAARFPTTRIKKIMQLDEDVGKLTATVPPVVSRALELFLEQLITQAYQLTSTRNSKTITPAFIKHVVEQEPRFEFLRKLVSDLPELKPSQSRKSSNNSTSKIQAESDARSFSSDNSAFSDDELVVSKTKLADVPPRPQKISRQRRTHNSDSESSRKGGRRQVKGNGSLDVIKRKKSRTDPTSSGKPNGISVIAFEPSSSVRDESLVDC